MVAEIKAWVVGRRSNNWIRFYTCEKSGATLAP